MVVVKVLAETVPMQKAPLGELQLEILRFLSVEGPLTVGEVAAQFGEARGLARTTILTVMERLREKGYLTRTKEAGVFRYAPYTGKAGLLRDLVHEFVEKSLEGSVSPFLAYLAEEKALSDDEIAALRQLLDAAAGPTEADDER
jgi:predicted transcriptional regulator